MIITLKGADFSNNNIGPLSSWLISREIGDGARYSGPIYVPKGGTFSATIVLAEGYSVVLAESKVLMGEAELDNVFTLSEDGKNLSINIDEVTGNIFIKIPTSILEDTNNYTLTIEPYPSDAVVTLVAAGYTQSGNSITVLNGTVVSWTVSAEGYIEQTGIWTANGSDESKNIKLVGEPYWIGEKLSGKAHGTGAASSYLQTQYYYITDEAVISELSGKTVDKMAFNFASKSGNNTPSGNITIYLVDPSNSAPTNWEVKAEIAVEAYPAGSQKEFDITPFTVPTGYTVGYRSSKSSILGGGYLIQDYKIGGAYYEDADATPKDAGLGGVDVHVQDV